MRLRSCPRATVLLAVVAVLLAACNAGGDASAPATDDDGIDAAPGDEPELGIAIASYDLAVGQDQRLIAGVLTADAVQLAFGSVEFQLGYLGDAPEGEAQLAAPVTATYLPVYGIEPEGEPTDAPTLLVGRSGAGVYRADVDLDEPGWYGLLVVAELDDGTVRRGQARFQVLAEHEVPTVGEQAPLVRNLTIDDVVNGDAPAVAVDSRAQDGEASSLDPTIHGTTLADAIAARTPAVVILSTPTYCVSAFCGPLTAELAELAPQHEDVAFIHIEVWEDFEERRLNEAAAAWIQTETGGNEPWVFLVDADGTIRARWDNVLDVAELEAELAAL